MGPIIAREARRRAARAPAELGDVRRARYGLFAGGGGRIEERRVAGRSRWLVRRFRDRAEAESRGYVSFPRSPKPRGADFWHRALQWNHAARTRRFPRPRAGAAVRGRRPGRALLAICPRPRRRGA